MRNERQNFSFPLSRESICCWLPLLNYSHCAGTTWRGSLFSRAPAWRRGWFPEWSQIRHARTNRRKFQQIFP